MRLAAAPLTITAPARRHFIHDAFVAVGLPADVADNVWLAAELAGLNLADYL